MNRIHSAILKHIRTSIAEGSSKADHYLGTLDDAELLRLMFANYRGNKVETRGMRLTNIGVEIMRCHFMFYDIERPEPRDISSKELIFLERRAVLPYFLSRERIVTFESELGIKLKLAGGDVAILMEIETG